MKRLYRKGLAAATAVALITASALPAGAFEVGARGHYWLPSLKATMKVGFAGTEFNVRDDLGISDSNTYSVEAFTGFGNHHLALSYTPLDYSADKTIARTILFKHRIYAAGTNVRTDLHLKMLDLEYRYDMLNFENMLAGLSVSLLGRLKYLDGEVKMNSVSAGEQRQTFDRVIPMIGAGTQIGLITNILDVRAQAAGIGYSSNYFIDALTEVALTPFPFTRLSAGYRYVKIKIDNIADTSGELDFYGPYLGLAVVW